MKYILALDQGTTSTRCLLYNHDGEPVFRANQEIACLYPSDGWVEQDSLDIYISTLNVINDCLTKMNINYDSIDSLGITNQRETTVVWDKETGMPIYNAIVWQSRQTQDICGEWKKYEDIVHNKTGLIINPYFSASKIRYILDKVPGAQERAEKGELCFGTIDCWLMFKLSNKKIFKTDVSNASRTMLFNINSMSWDDELLKLFNIPKVMLPEVCESSNYFGNATQLNADLKICGVAGDQQAALFGQNCFIKGESKNTYGTGCFMLMNIGKKPTLSQNGLLTTVAWSINGKVTYALEGSVFIGGASIQWLRDSLRMIKTAAESEKYATGVKDDGGVYCVPAFVGLGAPYWDNDCRGAIFGLTRATTKEHFIRAVLNSIALQTKDVIVTIEKDTGIVLKSLKVDGGATANSYLMQYQANILNTNIILPACVETTSLGAAYLSGLSTGFWKDIKDIKTTHKIAKTFRSKMSEGERVIIDKKWAKAVEATRVFK